MVIYKIGKLKEIAFLTQHAEAVVVGPGYDLGEQSVLLLYLNKSNKPQC
jgi:hypothetical protein